MQKTRYRARLAVKIKRKSQKKKKKDKNKTARLILSYGGRDAGNLMQSKGKDEVKYKEKD